MRNSLLTFFRLIVAVTIAAGALWSCQDEKPEIIFPDPVPEIPQNHKEFRYLESLTPDTVKFKKLKERDSIIFNIRTIPYDLLKRDTVTVQVTDTAGQKYEYADIESYTLRVTDSVWNVKTYINKGVKSGDVISLMVAMGDTAMYSDPIVLYIAPQIPRALQTLTTDSLTFNQIDTAVIRIKTLPLNLLDLENVNIVVTDSVGNACEAAQINSISLNDSVWNITTRIKYPIKTGDVIRLKVSDEDTVMLSSPIIIKIIPKPEPTHYSIMITSDSVSGFLDGGQATIRLKTTPWNVLFNDTTFLLALRDANGNTLDNKISIDQKEFVPDDSCWNVKVNILDKAITDAAILARLICPDTTVSSQIVNIRKVAISMNSIKVGNDLTMRFDSASNAFTCRVEPSANLKALKFLFEHNGDKVMLGDTLLTAGQFNTLDASKPITVTVWKYDVHVDFNLMLLYNYHIYILSNEISAFLKGDNQATVRLKTEPWDIINKNNNALALASTTGESVNTKFSIASKEFQEADSSWIVKVKIVNTSLTNDNLKAKLTCPDTVILSSAVNIKQVNPVMTKVLTGNDLVMENKPSSTFHYFYYNKKINAPLVDYTDQKFKFVYSDGDKVTVDDKIMTNDQYNKIDVSKPVTVSVWKYDVHRDYTIMINTGLPVIRISNAKSMATGYDRSNWVDGATMQIEYPDGRIKDLGNLSLRGRGNGTWTETNKKPFAIKLEEKSKVLGMHKHKRWILLANYKDRTLMRNDVAQWIARQTDMPYVINGRFVELIWNGEYMGNYYLCEQARIDDDRVNIAKSKLDNPAEGGYLAEIDTYFNISDLGSSWSKWSDKKRDAGFFSKTYNLPYVFKDPDENEDGTLLSSNSAAFKYFQNYVNDMEAAIYKASSTSHDYENYLDVDRAIDYVLIQELTMNHDSYNTWPTERPGPHSAFMYKDSLDKICFGPVWDFDYHTFTLKEEQGGGWWGSGSTSLQTSSRLSQWELLSMTNKGNNKYYFASLVNDPQFRTKLVNRWNKYKNTWKNGFNAYVDMMADSIRISEQYNWSKWGLNNPNGRQNGDEKEDFDTAVKWMKEAFLKRWDWIDKNIGKLK